MNKNHDSENKEKLGFLDFIFVIGMMKTGFAFAVLSSTLYLINSALGLSKLSLDRLAHILTFSFAAGIWFGAFLWVSYFFSRKNEKKDQ